MGSDAWRSYQQSGKNNKRWPELTPVFLPFYFNMNVYIQEITCCGALGVGGSEGGCPSQIAFLLLLRDNVIACSLFFLFSCDSGTQSSLECGIHLPHCYYPNLLKGDFVLKTQIRDVEELHLVLAPDETSCPPQLCKLLFSACKIQISQSFLLVLAYFPCQGFRAGTEHIGNSSYVWLLITLDCKLHQQ